jgi:hypothetical protein
MVTVCVFERAVRISSKLLLTATGYASPVMGQHELMFVEKKLPEGSIKKNRLSYFFKLDKHVT